MEELLQYMRSLNFDVGAAQLDGKIHRFSRNSKAKDNGWYIGFQHHGSRDGTVYVVAQFGDWKTNELHEFKPKSKKIPREDMELIKKRMDEARAMEAQARVERQDEAAERAARAWKVIKDTGSTEYTRRKAVTSLEGTKVGDKGELVIPMRDIDGKLWGLQRIYPDGAKIFTKGQKVSGVFFVIGQSLEDAEECYLCEGWATGGTIHMATGKTVICAFNSGNLVEVAKVLKDRYHDLYITVCGDDDRFNEVNAGREKAEKASMITAGPLYFPKFSDDLDKLTDYNDLHIKAGLEEVKKQLLGGAPDQEESGFIPLGFSEGTYFFYNIPSRDIVKASTFADAQLFTIAPRAYWAGRFATKNGTDWQAVKDHLIQTSRAVGPFDANRIRGTGVWLDRSRVVVNSGYRLLVNNEDTTQMKADLSYVYVQTKNRFEMTAKAPLTVEECLPIIQMANCFRWSRTIDGLMLAGWIALARIAGSLQIRPHIWITGGKGTGKSTIMEHFVRPLLGGPKSRIYLQGGSTEAGIRQEVGSSSLPLIFDEFETTDDAASKQRIQNLVQLLRQSWSFTNGAVVKGSVSGVAVQYQLCFAALVSSIRVNLLNDADKSRFSILELDPHKAIPRDWAVLSREMDQFTEEMGERLFLRSIKMLPVMNRSYHVLFKAISESSGNRVAQQMGMLLAAFWTLRSDEVISEAQAQTFAKDTNFQTYIEEDKPDDDAVEALVHLLTWRVRLSDGGCSAEKGIGQIIEGTNHWELTQLRSYGIIADASGISIANSHAELKKIFQNTRWVEWNRTIKRIPGVQLLSTVRFDKNTSRAVKVPMKIIRSVS